MVRSTRRRAAAAPAAVTAKNAAAAATTTQEAAEAAAPTRRSRRRKKPIEDDEEEKSLPSSQVNTEEENDDEDEADDDGSSSRASKKSARSAAGRAPPPKKKAKTTKKQQQQPPRRTTRKRRAVEKYGGEEREDDHPTADDEDDDDDDDVPLDKLVARARKKDGDDDASSKQTAGSSRRSRRGSLKSSASSTSGKQQQADNNDDNDDESPPPHKKKRRRSLGEDSTIGSIDTAEQLIEDDDNNNNKPQQQHEEEESKQPDEDEGNEEAAPPATKPAVGKRTRSRTPPMTTRSRTPPPTVRTSNRRRATANNKAAAAASTHPDNDRDGDVVVTQDYTTQDDEEKDNTENNKAAVESGDETQKKDDDKGDDGDSTASSSKEKHGSTEDDDDPTEKEEAVERSDESKKKDDSGDSNAVKHNEKKDDKTTEEANTKEAESCSGNVDRPEPNKSADGVDKEKGDALEEGGDNDDGKKRADKKDTDESKKQDESAVEKDQDGDQTAKQSSVKDSKSGKPNDPEPSQSSHDTKEPQRKSSDTRDDAWDPNKEEQPTVVDNEKETARFKEAEGADSKNDKKDDAASASKSTKEGDTSSDQKGKETAGVATTLEQQSTDDKTSRASDRSVEPQLLDTTTTTSGKDVVHPNKEDELLREAVPVIPPPPPRGDKKDTPDVVAKSHVPPNDSPADDSVDGKVASQVATAVAATTQEKAVEKAAAAAAASDVAVVDKASVIEESKKKAVGTIAAVSDPKEAGAEDKVFVKTTTTTSSQAAETKEKILDAAHTENRKDTNAAAESSGDKGSAEAKSPKGNVETKVDASVEVEKVAPASKPVPKKDDAVPSLEGAETTKDKTVPQAEVVDLTEEEKQEHADDPMDIDEPAVPSKKAAASSIETGPAGHAADISIKDDSVEKDTAEEPTPSVVVPGASILDIPMDVDKIERGSSSKIPVAAFTSTKDTAVESTSTSAETKNEGPRTSQNESIETTAPLNAATKTLLDQARLEWSKNRASDAASKETQGVPADVQRHESESALTEKSPAIALTSEKTATSVPAGAEKIDYGSIERDKAESESNEKIAFAASEAKEASPRHTTAAGAPLHMQPAQGPSSSNASKMVDKFLLSSKAPAPMEEQRLTGVAESSALGNTDVASTTARSPRGDVPGIAANEKIKTDVPTTAGREKTSSILRSGDATATARSATSVHVEKQPKQQPATTTAVTIVTKETTVSHASVPTGTLAPTADVAVEEKEKHAASPQNDGNEVQPNILAPAAGGQQTKDSATSEVHTYKATLSNANGKPNFVEAQKQSPEEDSVAGKTSLIDSADVTEVENLRIPTLSSEKQPVAQDTRVNLERIKVMIYSAGSRAHRSACFERMFAAYWKALSMRLGGRLSDTENAKCQKVVNSFLKTKQMRKLHNKLILALLGRCIQPTAPLRDISAFIPEQLLSRISIIPKPSPKKSPLEVAKKARKEIAQKEKDDQTESLAYNPLILENVPKPAASHEPPLSSASSMRIPGALVVDPRVRKIADAAGMKTSENAIWLLVIALKEFAMKLLDDTIATSKAVETDSVPSWPSIRPRILPKRPSKASHPKKQKPKRDEKPATKCITPFDIHTTTATIPCGYKSLGGCLSRSTFERSLFSSFDNSFVLGGSAFHEVKKFVVSSVTPREPEPKRTKTEAPVPIRPTPAQPSPSVKKPTKANEQNRKSPVSTGLGRGAKDLASLKARSSFSKSPSPGSLSATAVATGPVAIAQTDKSAFSGGAAAVPPAPAARVAGLTAPPAAQVASAENGAVRPATHVASASGPTTQTAAVAGSATRPASAPDPPLARNESEKDTTGSHITVTPRKGKGFGVKNLAAMRARSLTSNSEDAAQAAKAASASDDVKETAKPMESTTAAPVQIPVPPAGPSTTPTQPTAAAATTKKTQRTNPSPPAGSGSNQPEAPRGSPTLPKNAPAAPMHVQHYQQTSGTRHNLGPPFAGQNPQVPRQPMQDPAVVMANAQLAQGLASALMHNNGQARPAGFSGPRPNMIPYPGQTPQGFSLGQLAQMVPGMQQGRPFGQLPHAPSVPLHHPQQQMGSSQTAQNAQAMALAKAFAQNMAQAAAGNQGAPVGISTNAHAGQTAMGAQNQNFSARSPAGSTAGSERSSQSQQTGASAPPASAGPHHRQHQQQQQGGSNEQKK